MPNHGANMQGNERCQCHAGADMNQERELNQLPIIQRLWKLEKAEYTNGRRHHHDAGCQHDSDCQVNHYVNRQCQAFLK